MTCINCIENTFVHKTIKNGLLMLFLTNWNLANLRRLFWFWLSFLVFNLTMVAQIHQIWFSSDSTLKLCWYSQWDMFLNLEKTFSAAASLLGRKASFLFIAPSSLCLFYDDFFFFVKVFFFNFPYVIFATILIHCKHLYSSRFGYLDTLPSFYTRIF